MLPEVKNPVLQVTAFFCCPCVALFSALRLVNYLFIAAEAVSATKKVNYTILPS